ncbi:MAG: aminotransferase class III-fold pyridoxal phosphate-dependent enzyme, partial [Thermomonas sp.]
LTPALRANIQQRGKQALAMLESLKAESDGRITKVQGTGLLFSCELTKDYKGYGTGSTEEWMREHGIGVIHGGENSLRFTPQFAVSEDELALVVSVVKRALLEGPRQVQAAAA